jgi:Lipid A core - O-antigen ligase and related enzymes
MTIEEAAAKAGPVVRGWEWAQVALLAGNLTWTTLCLGGYRPETMVVTTALTGALLVVHLVGFALLREQLAGRDGGVARLHPAGWCLLPFLAYAAANVALVSPVKWIGWRDWIGWAQMIAVFWVVLNGVRTRGARAVLFGAMVTLAMGAVALACYQRFARPDWLMMGRIQADQFAGRASGPFGVPNSLAALLLLVVFPVAALALRRGASAVQRVFFGYVAAVLLLGLVLTISRGAWIAAVLVTAAWPLWSAKGALGRRLLLASGVMLGLLGVVAALFATVPDVRERLTKLKTDAGEKSRPIMWLGAWKIFREHPVWGSGAGSYNVVFEKHRPERYQDEPEWAHNDYLNTFSDYGAVGFVLFFGVAGGLAVMCGRKKTRAAKPEVRWRGEGEGPPVGAMAAGLAAFGLHLFVDFHWKIPALALAFGTMAALVVQRCWPAAAGAAGKWGGLERDFCLGLATFAAAGSIWFVNPLYRAEALRHDAREMIDRMAVRNTPKSEWRSVLVGVLSRLSRAAELDPKNGATWADISYATALFAQLRPDQMKELGGKAERTAELALERSRLVPEFWIRRGVALDLQGRRVEGGSAFVEALKLAPRNAIAWYYQAAHLSLDAANRPRALAAVGVALRLDPGKREAQALRERLAERSRAP